MIEKITPYQLTNFPSFTTDILKENHISAFFDTFPQRVTDVMTRILEVNYEESLDMLLNKLPILTFESTSSYEHLIYGSGRRNYVLIEARDEDGNPITSPSHSEVGANVARFELVFAEPAALFGETITGERREYPMRVVEQPRYEGQNIVLTVELFNGDTSGIPASLLMPGKRFYHGPAYVPRGLSTQVSGVRHTAPSKIINEFSTIRKTCTISNELYGQKVTVPIPVFDKVEGKVSNFHTWALYEEFEFEHQWSEDISEAEWSTISNRTVNGEYLNKDASGEKIIKGDGLIEQMRASNVYYYPKFTLKRFNDVVYRFNSGTEVIAFTGKEGATQAGAAIGEQASGYTNITLNADALGMVSKTTSENHPNALKFGFLFTEWLSPTGVTIKIKVLNFYDDPVKGILTINGKPADSYRYDIIDLGGDVSSKNIAKCQPADGATASGMLWGFRNSFTGQTWNPNMSFAVDKTQYEKFAYVGVLIKDPTRCVVMLPSIFGKLS